METDSDNEPDVEGIPWRSYHGGVIMEELSWRSYHGMPVNYVIRTDNSVSLDYTDVVI